MEKQYLRLFHGEYFFCLLFYICTARQPGLKGDIAAKLSDS